MGNKARVTLDVNKALNAAAELLKVESVAKEERYRKVYNEYRRTYLSKGRIGRWWMGELRDYQTFLREERAFDLNSWTIWHTKLSRADWEYDWAAEDVTNVRKLLVASPCKTIQVEFEGHVPQFLRPAIICDL